MPHALYSSLAPQGQMCAHDYAAHMQNWLRLPSPAPRAVHAIDEHASNVAVALDDRARAADECG